MLFANILTCRLSHTRHIKSRIGPTLHTPTLARTCRLVHSRHYQTRLPRYTHSPLFAHTMTTGSGPRQDQAGPCQAGQVRGGQHAGAGEERPRAPPRGHGRRALRREPRGLQQLSEKPLGLGFRFLGRV